ncbi:MAG: hypothetical protein PVI90_00365 [Desulfobacteraceae bacterium]|jgi:hypothetical protein
MTKKKTITLTANVLEQLLAERYPAPEWAFLPQVRDSTALTHCCTADALAFNCYPSRGMELHGFEIKVTKQDWLNELRDPNKSVALQQYCDRWWLVISKEDFVEQGTLPSTWGMLAVQSTHGKLQLKVVHPAPKLEAPILYNKGFVTSVFRNAMRIITPEAQLAARYAEGRTAGIEEGKRDNKSYINTLKRELDNALNAIHEFQVVSGIQLKQWNAGDLGEAVKLLTRHRSPLAILKRQRELIANLTQALDLTINKLSEENDM